MAVVYYPPGLAAMAQHLDAIRERIDEITRPAREMQARLDQFTGPIREFEARVADFRRRLGWVEVDAAPSDKRMPAPGGRGTYEIAGPKAAADGRSTEPVAPQRKPELDAAVRTILASDGYPAFRPGGWKRFCDKVRGLSGTSIDDRTVRRHVDLLRGQPIGQLVTSDMTKLRVVSQIVRTVL